MVSVKPKVVRTSTVAMSLDVLLPGQLAFLNQYFEVLGVSGNDSHLQTVKEREGVEVRDIKMSRSISPLQDVISLVKLYRLFKKEKPQIVHSITPKAGLLSMAAAWMANVPIRAHTFTGLIFPSKKGVFRGLLIFVDRILCYFATAVYPEGQGVKNDLITYKITKKSLKIMANGNLNGINLEYFSLNALNHKKLESLKADLKAETSFVFLFIGRLVKDKGIVELVSSFERLYNERNDIKLILVGPLEQDLDPLPPKVLDNIMNHLGIVKLGFQEDVRPYIAISDVLVFPSYREGFPNVPLQCGAFKKAMILSDINGCNEIVANGVSGLLVPPKSTDEVYKAMKYMADNPEKRKTFGEAAYNHIRQNFEQQTVWSAIREEYNVQLKNEGLDV